MCAAGGTIAETDVIEIHVVTVVVNQNDFCRTAAVIAVSIAGIFTDVDKSAESPKKAVATADLPKSAAAYTELLVWL
nr:hypothetical protein [Tanacetum cinerariifolium]